MFSSSPRLIAAYRVFLRLPTPRHPPDALLLLVSRKKLPSIPMQLLKSRPHRVRQARAWFATGTIVPAPLKRGPDNAHASAWRLSAVVGLERLELSTSRLSGVRSNHLSYRPFRSVFSLPAASHARPPRSCMSRYTPVGSLAASRTPRWWSWTGLNRRPPACKAGALPAELQPQPLTLHTHSLVNELCGSLKVNSDREVLP